MKMKRIGLVGSVVVAAAVAGTGWAAETNSVPRTEVALENIHGTTGQAKIQRVAFGGGVSMATVFLVRGTNIADAAKATQWVVTGECSADVAGGLVAGHDANGKTAPLWAVAYMGSSHSSPPAWVLESVTFEKNTVRVTCRKPKHATSYQATTDMHPYWCWIPLGVSDKGTYRIELIDAESHEVLVMRRVEVK